ncbi:MAG: GAF domain-containing protein [Sphingobacteriales bacterium]|nr:MAG: GAF domain-containing protein [Sphingobacteriales bacterium]
METAILEKRERYETLLRQMRELIVDGIPAEGNISNLLAHLKTERNLFWVGLYMRTSENALGLGIFQGMPACTKIHFGKGVCGTAAEKAETVIVDDVSEFPGYIACHSEAQSEIVIPGFNDFGEVSFVLDVDSVELAKFDAIDKEYLEKVVKLFEEILNADKS